MTAFLSVASKTGGFVAMLSLVYVGFFGRGDAWQPILWVLAAASMTVGNLIALRQTNLVRMLAYSSIAQGGFMLVPFAVANQGDGSARPEAFSATVVYLLIYAVMNLGAFAALIAIARKTRSAEIDTYAGLFNYAPALAVTMSLFLFSLAGIPPLGRLVRQARGLQGGDRGRHGPGRHPRCRRRPELGDRAVLLRRGGRQDVVPARAGGSSIRRAPGCRSRWSGHRPAHRSDPGHRRLPEPFRPAGRAGHEGPRR